MEHTPGSGLNALLVDPALFTAPYDAALSDGLEAAGVGVRWASRPLRPGELSELSGRQVEPIFYRGVQASARGRGVSWRIRKGLSHLLGGLRLLALARRGRFAIVHFQWAVFPLYDAMLMRLLASRSIVVVTVHDLNPYNGNPTSSLQAMGYVQLLRAASRVIVHREDARQALIGKGLQPEKIVTIPHGPLSLANAAAPERTATSISDRWRVVLFGKLQPYKGVDVLIEALGRLSAQERARLEVIIAGEALIPLEPLVARIAELELGATVRLDPRRLSEDEMAELFSQADAFVFPYRHIEASGVLFLISPYNRWIVASDLGAFRDLISPGRNGELVPADDTLALAKALMESVGKAPDADHALRLVGWDEIGARTRAVYESALAERDAVGR